MIFDLSFNRPIETHIQNTSYSNKSILDRVPTYCQKYVFGARFK